MNTRQKLIKIRNECTCNGTIDLQIYYKRIWEEMKGRFVRGNKSFSQNYLYREMRKFLIRHKITGIIQDPVHIPGEGFIVFIE